MAVKPSDIKWGAYKDYEGPFFRGTIRYKLPENPTEADRRLRVFTATEGGHYDAINMYDRCIVSTGLAQWCEARYYLTSRLLHAVCEEINPGVVIGALTPALEFSCAEFKKNAKGQWRFHVMENGEPYDRSVEVNTLERQQKLFLGCTGKKGSWDERCKVKAKLWASCLANVWQDPEARAVQVKHTSARSLSFAMPDATKILFGKDTPSNEGWPGMLRAAYLSFAGNLPAVANKELGYAVIKLKSPKWSPQWCIGVLKQLTWGPDIKIYPRRYEAIRPWLERLWDGVDLPATAEALKSWTEEDWVEPVDIVIPPPPSLPSIPEIEDSEELSVEEDIIVDEEEPLKEEPSGIQLRDPSTLPTLPRGTQTPAGALGWILYVLHIIMSFFLKKEEEKSE